MTKEEANRILDQHKEGKFYTGHTINTALECTGDLSDLSGLSNTPGEAESVERRCLALGKTA